MCRLYTKNNQPSYVRLCYRTGYKGHRLDLTIGTIEWRGQNGCVRKELRPTGGSKQRRAQRRTQLSFRAPGYGIRSFDHTREDIQEMARWSFCEASVADGIITLSTPDGEKRVKYDKDVIARARSFGWELVNVRT